MIIAIEGITICFILLLVLVIGMAYDGPVGMVCFYEKDVQDRVIELKLTTKERIRKATIISGLAVTLPLIILVPYMVYGINGAVDFKEGFVQMLLIGMIGNLFDRLFIDWYWVGKTNAWNIPGTEDLKPYIPKTTLIKKWFGTLMAMPLLYALIAWLMTVMK